MIRIPKGKPVHKELSSTFVDMRKLLEELKSTGFSGVVELVGLKHEGEILLDNGTATNVWIRGDQELLGKHNLAKVLDLGKQETLLISTFMLPPESVAFLSGFLGSQLVLEHLSSEFTEPRKLINKFEQEQGDFFVEVTFQKNLGSGMIFIQDGQAMEAIMSLMGKELITGESAIRELIDASRELGAIFNVYKGQLQAAPAPEEPPPAPPAPVEPEISLPEVTAIQQILIGRFEQDLARENAKAIDFDVFFRESCLDMADTFPFLDPFAAEFCYRGGQLQIDSVEAVPVLVKGGIALIQNMLERLGKKKMAFPLEAFRTGSIEQLKQQHGQAMDVLKLDDLINSLHEAGGNGKNT